MKFNTFVTTTALATVLSAGSSLAQAGAEHATKQKDIQDWAAMRTKAIPASEILAGEVRNIANPVGQVEELILNEKSTGIQYVLFETPFPYSYYTSEDGFLKYESVELDDNHYGGVDLLVEDPEISLPRNQLTLTRGEARGRRVSHLIGSDIRFAGDEDREVEDILVHPKTGVISHYLVEMDADALFDEDTRAVRATQVSMSKDGRLVADLKVTEVEAKQDIDPRFL